MKSSISVKINLQMYFDVADRCTSLKTVLANIALKPYNHPKMSVPSRTQHKRDWIVVDCCTVPV